MSADPTDVLDLRRSIADRHLPIPRVLRMKRPSISESVTRPGPGADGWAEDCPQDCSKSIPPDDFFFYRKVSLLAAVQGWHQMTAL